MIDNNYLKIKERLVQNAMDLWGISNKNDLDPIIDLLLDVFAYESNLVNFQIEDSDKQIISRLSRLLVGNKWSLPVPCHALLHVDINHEENADLSIYDHFVVEKYFFDKQNVTFYFTPLLSQKIINAQIKYIAYNDKLKVFETEDSNYTDYKVFSNENRINDYNLWIGIDISETTFLINNELTLCFYPEDKHIISFWPMFEFYDIEGNKLKYKHGLKSESPNDENYYIEEITRYYSDCYFTIDITTEIPKYNSIIEKFPKINYPNAEKENNSSIYWLRVKVPEIFDAQMLDKIKIFINTFPIVNRELQKIQHSFENNGRIISLTAPENCELLNIDSFSDDLGNIYEDRIKNFKPNPTGVYSLYFDNLEKFNYQNANSMLARVLQLARENGNAFKALNIDNTRSIVSDLENDINKIWKILNDELKDLQSGNAYLLASPIKGAVNSQINYWVTSRLLGDNLNISKYFKEKIENKFKPESIYLCTEISKGITLNDDDSLLNSLRYGLLSKERIVSKEDIKNYILHKFGSYVKDIEILNDVAISENRKKGLTRITKINLKIDYQYYLSLENLPLLINQIESDLAEHSISNTIYKLEINGD